MYKWSRSHDQGGRHGCAMAINSKTFKNLLLQNQKAYDLKLGMRLQAMESYKVCINHDPGMTLTYFKARSTYVRNAFERGKLLIYDLRGKICRKWANRQNIYVYEKILSLGGCMPLPQGYIQWTRQWRTTKRSNTIILNTTMRMIFYLVLRTSNISQLYRKIIILVHSIS